MPTVLINGYKFQFYSSDESEPPHVHILRDSNAAKIWLSPIEVEYNRGYNTRELNKIVRLTQEYRDKLLERWNAHFGKR